MVGCQLHVDDGIAGNQAISEDAAADMMFLGCPVTGAKRNEATSNGSNIVKGKM